MFWIIVIIGGVIGAIAYNAVQKKKEEEENELAAYEKAKHAADSNSSEGSTVSSAASVMPVDETIENQSVSQCLPRFCGAIDAIRNENSWRDSSQGGTYAVSKREDGCYSLYGFYNHDSDSGVMYALSFHGYLKYMGIEYQEDGFKYELEGLKDQYAEPYLSESWVVDYFKNYFGSNVSIVVNSARKGGIMISFRFPA